MFYDRQLKLRFRPISLRQEPHSLTAGKTVKLVSVISKSRQLKSSYNLQGWRTTIGDNLIALVLTPKSYSSSVGPVMSMVTTGQSPLGESARIEKIKTKVPFSDKEFSKTYIIVTV